MPVSDASVWQFNMFRTFDPRTGRYLEADPLGRFKGMDLYPYALNNPTNFADPLGLDVTITIDGRGYSPTGRSVSGTFSAASSIAPLIPFEGLTMENADAGECACKPPIPQGSYVAFVRLDGGRKRIELIGVSGYTNIQIHAGSYPRNYRGCIGVGLWSGIDFLGGSRTAVDAILELIRADGTNNIRVDVGAPPPLGPLRP
jgi:uncharacterized protein RhaS with RHS repeats